MTATLHVQQRTSRTVRHLRWYISGLLVLATTLSYLDRQTLAVAVTSKSLEMADDAYSIVQASFLLAPGVMQPVTGRMIDWLGARRGYALCVVFWSMANIGHSLATGMRSFASLRFLLGAGEAGNYPGAMKVIAAWFPPRERALATGVFNLGSGIGAIIAPPLVATIILLHSWQAAFVITGSLGLAWFVLWLVFYREPHEHRLLSDAERDLITSDNRADSATLRQAGWGHVLRHREIWGVMLAKFLTDPGWYFYLFWLPRYLKTAHGFDLKSIAMFAWMPYVCADIGCVVGGMISAMLARRGMSVMTARKTALCACAVLMPLAIPAGYTSSPALSLVFICLATFGHQCWSSNLLVMPADLFPRSLVASASGLGGMAGILGATLFTYLVGKTVGTVGYGAIFTTVGVLYPTAALLFISIVRQRGDGRMSSES